MPWRTVGAVGKPWPAWVRELDGKSGVYAIKEADGGPVLYVGESHTGNLYGTLTRHFQRWTRQTKPRGVIEFLFGRRSTDPGHVYDRRDVLVRVLTCPARLAISKQSEWIGRLRPLDNEGGGEDAPF